MFPQEGPSYSYVPSINYFEDCHSEMLTLMETHHKLQAYADEFGTEVSVENC